jgi:predicted transposase YbfD/YdcC
MENHPDVEVLLSWFSDCFADLPDPRTGNAKHYKLLDVLTIALTAAICGAESCTDFADFAADREDLFREFLDLERGLPSHDTFSRIFGLLDPVAFATCFGRFVDDLGAAGAGVVAIDGKTLRRSFDAAGARSPLAAVSAFASASELVVGHQGYRPGEGDSEILAARKVLTCLDLQGVLVTADAIHCQRETAEIVQERGGDYLFALKDNRPALHKEVASYFEAAIGPDWPPLERVDQDHGRLEVRRHWVSLDLEWLNGPRRAANLPELLPGLRALAMVESERTHHGKTSRTRRYYLTSALLTPERFATAVRAHWRIENSLHWVLDETFDEDKARNRRHNGPENLAILRKLALNVLRNAGPNISIRRKRKRSGWSNAFARNIIGQVR